MASQGRTSSRVVSLEGRCSLAAIDALLDARGDLLLFGPDHDATTTAMQMLVTCAAQAGWNRPTPTETGPETHRRTKAYSCTMQRTLSPCVHFVDETLRLLESLNLRLNFREQLQRPLLLRRSLFYPAQEG